MGRNSDRPGGHAGAALSSGHQRNAHRGCVPGTTILTRDGAIPVEFLTPGDRIITRTSGYATLLRLDFQCYLTPAVTIAAGALGTMRLDRDLTLHADQAVLIRGHRAAAMVRAADLVDGKAVHWLGVRPLTLLSLRFAEAHVIYAGGLELASGAPVASPERRAA